MSSFPKRADHFKKWSQMMLEQALVPERLEYKGASSTSRKSRGASMGNKGMRTRRGRRKRFLRRKRRKQE